MRCFSFTKIIHSIIEKKETGVDSENHEKHMQKPYGKKYRIT
jgi:hypothetical protein